MDIHDNGGAGVVIGSNDNRIMTSHIHHNGGPGVFVAGSAVGNEISANRIHDNGGLGIDLSMKIGIIRCDPTGLCQIGPVPDGVTSNDGAGDPDSPVEPTPNDFQNFPVIDSVTATSVKFDLVTLFNHKFRVEAFSSPSVDPSLHGEGAEYLGSVEVTTDQDGNASGLITFPAVPAGSWISLTAIELANLNVNLQPLLANGDFSPGDTSEFSRAVQVPGGGPDGPGDPGDDDDGGHHERKCQKYNHNNRAHPNGHDPKCPVKIRTEATPSIGEPGDTFRDKAWVIDASGGKGPKVEAPRGTVTFFLCGPNELTDDGCEKGTQVGDPQKVKKGAIWSPKAKGKLTTREGKYCWRVYYSGDVNYFQKTHTNRTTECFRVRDDGPGKEL